MKGPIAWMAKNHVAANLLMAVFIVGGLIVGLHVKQEIFPEIDLDQVLVTVVYPGAGPEEIEDGIILNIEEYLSGVDGIKRIDSVASEGVGTVSVLLLEDEDPDQVLQDVKAEVDRIDTFPEDAEKPIITKLSNRREVLSVVVYGNLSEWSLREYAESIRDDLLTSPEITLAELRGVRPYEISIEVTEATLRRFGITLDYIADVIRKASLDLPAGSVRAEGGEILLRTKEKRYVGQEYENITVLTRADGMEIKLRDIATVKDTFAETDTFATFDGLPAATVSVFRVGDQRPTTISQVVRKYVEQKTRTLPEGIQLAVWFDRSEILKQRMDLLLKNAYLGLILVLLTLGIFLEARLAFWVTLGIPISFLGAFFFMPVEDVSVNMISLFAFIMALGIVVDDAIVIGENVCAHRQMGKSYGQAAIDGTLEVAGAVIFSILTTIAAFAPLLFVEGSMGKFIGVIPKVVILILLISLIEALFVLPSHLSIKQQSRGGSGGLWGTFQRFRQGFAQTLERFIAGPYKRVLSLSLEYRYTTTAISVAILMISMGLIAGGILKFRFLPDLEGDVIMTTLEMPYGTPVQETMLLQKVLVDKAREVVGEYDQGLDSGKTILRNMYAVVGSTLARGGPAGGTTSSGSHLCEVFVYLHPSDQRANISTAAFADRWRKKVGGIPGAESLTFVSGIVRFGADIDIQLAHNDFDVLFTAADRVKATLAEYAGTGDIADSYAPGKKELKLRLRPEARDLGITELDLGRQVRAAFYGAEALRMQRGRNEVKVMVRFPEEDRQSLGTIQKMRIRTTEGGEIPFFRAAFVEQGRGYSAINRSDRKRVIDITASVDSKGANPQEILQELENGILKELMVDYPGLSYKLRGESEELDDTMNSLKRGFLLALFVMYALLAIPFRSYSKPVIVMSAIPFGVVGAMWGHLLMGYNLSIMSVFGIVALSGVVVNDSLILITFINQLVQEEIPVRKALLDAGMRRFRPIILTSLTTFFGLMPMISETSFQARFLIPMAISLGFGILFATGITLVLVPSLYLMLEDVKYYVLVLWRRVFRSMGRSISPGPEKAL